MGRRSQETWIIELTVTTPDALPYFIKDENIDLFKRHKVFDEEEVHSRYEIMMEEYVKILHIEALTMVNMAQKEILPAVSQYSYDLAQTCAMKTEVAKLENVYEKET